MMARQDPEAALEFAGKMGLHRYGDLQGLWEAWAERDPAAAAAKAMEVMLGQERESAIRSIVWAWAERDPQGELSWVKDLPRGALKHLVPCHAGGALANFNPEAVAAYAASVPRLRLASFARLEVQLAKRIDQNRLPVKHPHRGGAVLSHSHMHVGAANHGGHGGWAHLEFLGPLAVEKSQDTPEQEQPTPPRASLDAHLRVSVHRQRFAAGKPQHCTTAPVGSDLIAGVQFLVDIRSVPHPGSSPQRLHPASFRRLDHHNHSPARCLLGCTRRLCPHHPAAQQPTRHHPAHTDPPLCLCLHDRYRLAPI